MTVVIKLFPFFEADLANGRYLQAADVEADNGRGTVEVTEDIEKAMKFSSSLKAIQFWRQQSKTHPLRPDGKENRPLTAFHAMIENVKKDAGA